MAPIYGLTTLPPFLFPWVVVTLESGERVYVPRQLLEAISPANLYGELVFIERGLLGRTAWMGTAEELTSAVEDKLVTPKEALAAGWKPPRNMGPEVKHVAPRRVRIVQAPDGRTLDVLKAIIAASRDSLIRRYEAGIGIRFPEAETGTAEARDMFEWFVYWTAVTKRVQQLASGSVDAAAHAEAGTNKPPMASGRSQMAVSVAYKVRSAAMMAEEWVAQPFRPFETDEADYDTVMEFIESVVFGDVLRGREAAP